MNNLDFKAAVGEMTDAVSYLRSTGSPKVGVCGFCMGGALSFAAAQHAGVDCAAPFYGIPDPAICDVSGAWAERLCYAWVHGMI
jgi:carboxymethylenebutenolidase